jgi:putative tricarboxylic transport membrane protein
VASGSLLNLAQGKFGRYDETAVRWLAAIGTDYGAVTVREESPLKDFDDLIEALRNDPTGTVIGAGGTVWSQDRMQAAIVARSAGVDPQKLRYVAFEGGGEPITALLGRHVQAITSLLAIRSHAASERLIASKLAPTKASVRTCRSGLWSGLGVAAGCR